MSDKINTYICKILSLLIVITLLLTMSSVSFSQQQISNLNQGKSGDWKIRFNQNNANEFFSASVSKSGFIFKTKKVDSKTGDLSIFCYSKLEKPIKSLSFDYKIEGDASLIPITLFDAAANEIWHYDGQDTPPERVELNDLNIRGQIAFRINRNQSVELPEGWSHSISNIKIAENEDNPVTDKDGFIFVDNLTDFRGYASEDNVKIRLKPGLYQVEKAISKQFIEFTGNNSCYDLHGVNFAVNTKLFRQTDMAQGIDDANLYCVMGLFGNQMSIEGIYIETYGNQPGIQSRNKIFNIAGSGIILKNAEIRTEGSNPWGFGSLYGIGGGDVRKMNGIRVGWPSKNVKLIGCRVHMRAMGHAIFVQGAENTIIEDCHVDGLLRTTDDILSDSSGYSFDKNFYANRGGYIEGVVVADDRKILPGEMISLSEDGIRMYPSSQQDKLTGSTTIINCTVTNMRRGICTGLSTAGDKVINCQVTNCVAAGFNVGKTDTLINCRADAKYAEALCLPYSNAQNADVDMEILDSREGMGNSLMAKINGTGHNVSLRTSNPAFIPVNMTIELACKRGYGVSRSETNSVNINLDNQTNAKVLLLPGTVNAQVKSKGEVVSQSEIK